MADRIPGFVKVCVNRRGGYSLWLELHDSADVLALMHQGKLVVDVFEFQFIGNYGVNLDLAVHVPIHNFGTSVRPDAPPNAALRQLRPVTNWKCRVLISAPAGATPIMMLSPHHL